MNQNIAIILMAIIFIPVFIYCWRRTRNPGCTTRSKENKKNSQVISEEEWKAIMLKGDTKDYTKVLNIRRHDAKDKA